MPITEIPIFSMLRTRMQWHQQRQQVLAENVANADTPNYRARDLTPLKFDPPADVQPATVRNVSLERTDAGHLAGFSGGETQFATTTKTGYEIRPTGNAVSLEEEMMKVAANQMDYQAATAIYTHSLALIKTALGKVGGSSA
jgi:flagellar basal-body rod protein FlgB